MITEAKVPNQAEIWQAPAGLLQNPLSEYDGCTQPIGGGLTIRSTEECNREGVVYDASDVVLFDKDGKPLPIEAFEGLRHKHRNLRGIVSNTKYTTVNGIKTFVMNKVGDSLAAMDMSRELWSIPIAEDYAYTEVPKSSSDLADQKGSKMFDSSLKFLGLVGGFFGGVWAIDRFLQKTNNDRIAARANRNRLK